MHQLRQGITAAEADAEEAAAEAAAAAAAAEAAGEKPKGECEGEGSQPDGEQPPGEPGFVSESKLQALLKEVGGERARVWLLSRRGGGCLGAEQRGGCQNACKPAL